MAIELNFPDQTYSTSNKPSVATLKADLTTIETELDTVSGSLVGTTDTQTLSNKTLTAPVLNGSLTGTGVKDEDDMSSDSATAVPTQQSTKAYVDSGTVTMTNKTLTSPTVTGMDWDGWTASSDTWTYASATTFTISGVDRTSTFTKGTKLKLTNGSTKYFWVVKSSFSTDTTVTVTGESDLADAAITSPQYSYIFNPQGMTNAYETFCAEGTHASAQSISDATVTEVTLGTETYDYNSNFASNGYVAPITGRYLVTGHVNFYDASEVLAQAAVYIRIDGATAHQATVRASRNDNDNQYYDFNITREIVLVKGEEVTIAVYGDTADNTSFVISNGAGPQSFLNVRFVGLDD